MPLVVLPTTRTHKRRSAGFTLVELLVSVALGLVVITGMISMYVNVSRTNTEMAKTNGLIENGRFAIDLLAEDIAHAGYWGGYVPQFDDLITTTAPTDTPASTPDPCLAFNAVNWDTAYRNALIGLPVQVFSAAPTGCTSIVADKQANTDVLVVRRTNNCATGVGSCEADNAAKVYLQRSLCDTEIAANSRFVLGVAGFTLKLRNCTSLAEKRKFISNIYYIRNYATTAGDGIPTLMRSNFDLDSSGAPGHTPPTALIEGIQGFAVELGLDALSRCATPVDYTTAPAKVDPASCTVNTINADLNTTPTNRGDGVPELPFVHCSGAGGCTSTQLVNAVAAKIYVLARNKEATPGYTDTKTYALGSTTLGPFRDGFQRHVFQLTVRLNNVSSRRETP